MIHADRIVALNDAPFTDGKYVLYWMQASQREEYNHALEHAARTANKLKLPLVVGFGLTDNYPEANLRHYAFMLVGLAETRGALAKRSVQLVVKRGSPPMVAIELARRAAAVIVDAGYLRHQKQWRAALADAVACRVEDVETDVVVPVETVSNKEEYAAATIRPKIHRVWDDYLRPLRRTTLKRNSLAMRFPGNVANKLEMLTEELQLDHSVTPSEKFIGGTAQAKKWLRKFLSRKLSDYGTRRNDPSLDIQSHMSPYLHFGQISPLYIALQVQKANAPAKAKNDYLEELIVRRELAMNFVYFNPRYDAFTCLPDWARKALSKHGQNRRKVIYSLKKLESAGTHDPYWNAAMREMLVTGKMHNYMRMYWGKKILEWTPTPQRAYKTTLYLNNKYFLDGRDPVSYANVAWCFGKHDRPWTERPIFGTVRYMNAAGLERKFDIDAYVRQMQTL